MELRNQNVIVAGAAGGLGLELTKQLLGEGAKVAAIDINGDNLKKLESGLNTQNLKIYIVDMTNADSITSFKGNFHKDFDSADIIINSAGIIQPFKKIDSLNDQVINKVMNVNFFGPVNLIRQFMEDFTKNDKERFIVNVSAVGGFFAIPGQTMACASKAALKVFTEGLAGELKNTKTRVMVVLPGSLATDIAKNSEVTVSAAAEGGSYKMLTPKEAASQIIKGIKKNKFKLFLGSDAKFMKFLYKTNSAFAIKFISKQMNFLD